MTQALLTTELARVRSQLANEENRSARAQAEARNLTVQAALRRIEATVDIGVQPTNLTNRSLADAEKDLAKAMPFVEEAERVRDRGVPITLCPSRDDSAQAANSIKPNDLNEVKKLGKPSDIIKLVFDLVGLLKMEKMVKTEPAEVTMGA